MKWRKDVPGGVLSTVAVKNNLAVFTATDGKIRAWDAATGAEKWVYDGKAPVLRGRRDRRRRGLRGRSERRPARRLAGRRQETCGRSMSAPTRRCSRPAKSYGSPVVQDGQIYLGDLQHRRRRATNSRNVVVCIADHAGRFAAGLGPDRRRQAEEDDPDPGEDRPAQAAGAEGYLPDRSRRVLSPRRAGRRRTRRSSPST